MPACFESVAEGSLQLSGCVNNRQSPALAMLSKDKCSADRAKWRSGLIFAGYRAVSAA
jgi:hypothetical protein